MAYSAAELTVFLPLSNDTSEHLSGEWRISPTGSETVVLGTHSFARLCIKLKRSSNSDMLTIIFAMLLVAASYSGFYVSPSAAPARIALAFLCFLMVLNNLNMLLSRLPPLLLPESGNSRVWMSDFLFGTMIFNFVPLLEYAAVNYGISCAAAKKASAPGVAASKDGEKVILRSEAEGEAPRGRMGAGDLSCLVHLDAIFRWLFPAGYFIFITVMFSINDVYGSGSTTCDFHSSLLF